MILAIFVFSIAVVVGAVAFIEDDCAVEMFTTLFGLVGFVSFIATIILCCKVVKLRVIDEKIDMYQEANAKIEEQIAITVKEYQAYETEIFTGVKSESAVTLVALYPELKADTLVQQQLVIYIDNNEKIIDLKEDKINGKVARWWLYFGG